MVVGIKGRIEVDERIEELEVVAAGEAHRIFGQLGELALGQLGRQQEGLQDLALPRHPHEGQRRAHPPRPEVERIDIEDLHVRPHLEDQLGERGVEHEPAHPVAEYVVEVALASFHRGRDARRVHRLQPIVRGKQPEHVGASLDRSRVAIDRAVEYVVSPHFGMLGGIERPRAGNERSLRRRGRVGGRGRGIGRGDRRWRSTGRRMGGGGRLHRRLRLRLDLEMELEGRRRRPAAHRRWRCRRWPSGR